MEKMNPLKIYETENQAVVNLSDGKIPPQAIDLEEAVLGAMLIDEPLGGAHYNPSEAYSSVRENILYFSKKIRSLSKDKMIESRRKKFTKIGKFKG